nr:hypothetical protein [Blastococcus sp. TF02-8]
MGTDIEALLGEEAESLLRYRSLTGVGDVLTRRGPGYVDEVLASSDRPPRVLVNFQRMLGAGRLGGTGYVSILPVDQGVEHSAAASFAPTLATSIRWRSSASPSRAAATPSPPHWACSASPPAATPTTSLSSSS